MQFDLLFLCAGRGTRVGLDIPKQFVSVGGIPLLLHSLSVYNRLPQVARKIIVHSAADSDHLNALLQGHGISNYLLVAGGESRQESVRRGLDKVQTTRVVSHNAAVPFISADLIHQVTSQEADCVTTACELKDNLVSVENQTLLAVSRANLRIINSPQCFTTDSFRSAHKQAEELGLNFNSDTELMLRFGFSVKLVPGPAWVFKVTDRVDLALAEAILTRRDLFPSLG